jgi:hypothetical protein
MLTARNVVTATIVVAILSVVGTCLSLLRLPAHDGLGGDTFGTRAHGQRALFQVLSELDIPTERLLLPPDTALDREITLVFWSPLSELVQLEPAYLQAVSRWIRGGGRVVVAPASTKMVKTQPTVRQKGVASGSPESIIKALGVTDVSLQYVNCDGSALKLFPGRTIEELVREDVPGSLLKRWSVKATPTRNMPVQATGKLSGLNDVVSSLALIEYDLQVINTGDSQPSGALTFKSDDGVERTLVALYSLEKGEVLVVSDPSLAENFTVAGSDNSVLAVHLVAGAERPVVFDEFYHGLTIRGNPMWLFTRRTYRLLGLMLLMVTGVIVWHQSVFLGPPLETVGKSRRTIREYIDAASRLLNRGKSSYQFLLVETRSGVLWKLRHDLALPQGEERPEMIVAAIDRRDPKRARQLVDALELIDGAIAKRGRLAEKNTIHILQRILSCL